MLKPSVRRTHGWSKVYATETSRRRVKPPSSTPCDVGPLKLFPRPLRHHEKPTSTGCPAPGPATSPFGKPGTSWPNVYVFPRFSVTFAVP